MEKKIIIEKGEYEVARLSWDRSGYSMITRTKETIDIESLTINDPGIYKSYDDQTYVAVRVKELKDRTEKLRKRGGEGHYVILYPFDIRR